MVKIERAVRRQAKLRLALTGPSGAGKTFSALLIAFGIGGKVLVGDTENHSASLYADMTEGPLTGKSYDVAVIDPPYTIPKYLEIIEAAEKNGYDVLVLDSISHAWAGEGGLLQKKEHLDQHNSKSNQYTNWAPITKEHEAFKARLLNCGTHLICTMRSKQDYVLEDAGGKKVPRKVGMAPIQREGMEYEFTAVLDLGMDHSSVASKHRTGRLLDGKVFVPNQETGVMLREWLMIGQPEPARPKPATKPADAKPSPKPSPKPDPRPPAPKLEGKITSEQAIALAEVCSSFQALSGWTTDQITNEMAKYAKKNYGLDIAGITDLSAQAAYALIGAVDRWRAAWAEKFSDKQADPEEAK